MIERIQKWPPIALFLLFSTIVGAVVGLYQSWIYVTSELDQAARSFDGEVTVYRACDENCTANKDFQIFLERNTENWVNLNMVMHLGTNVDPCWDKREASDEAYSYFPTHLDPYSAPKFATHLYAGGDANLEPCKDLTVIVWPASKIRPTEAYSGYQKLIVQGRFFVKPDHLSHWPYIELQQ